METKRRSILKAFTYRIMGSCVTAFLVYCFTQRSVLAVGAGVADSVVKILAYFIHERIWAAIPYGVLPHPPAKSEHSKPLAAEHEEVLRQELNEMGNLPNQLPSC